MKKLEIAKKVATKTGLTITKTVEVINELFNQIESALKSGEAVNLSGFATLKPIIVRGQKAGGLTTVKRSSAGVLPDYLKIKVMVSREMLKRIKYDNV